VPKPIRLITGLSIILMIALTTASPAFAQDITGETAIDFTALLPAALTLLLPLGMILLISSGMPEDKAPATAINLLMVWGVAALGYFGVGFAFHFGGIAQVSRIPDLGGLYWEWYPLGPSVETDVARLWGVIALRGWFLTGEAATPGALRLFLSHVSLVGVAAMIPACILLQRTRGIVAILTGLLMGTLVYPVAGNWLWGGGWLSNLGGSLALGHGLVDFGGASVIFLTGSAVALIGLILFRSVSSGSDEAGTEAEVVVVASTGDRLTVYDEASDISEGESLLEATPMPSAYLPILSLLGGGLMLLGWFGLTTGVHAPTALNFTPVHAAVNGLLAALSGALMAAAYSWITTQELNPLMTSRGLVAALVVAMAGAPFIPIWVLVVSGLVMGLLLSPLVYLFNQGLGLADELGVLATYGVSAIVSLLLVAFLADGQAGQGWNGIEQGVAGLWVAPGFVPDWPGQLQAQFLGMVVILIWALLLSFLLYQIINTISDAWARTGLELADRSLTRTASAQPETNEPIEDQIDPQITISS